MSQLRWNDDRLVRIASDPPIRRRYRRLQSWYRETILHAPYGFERRRRPLGNLLAAEAVMEEPGLNFLHRFHPSIADYVRERIPQVRQAKGTLDEDRLRRNMLSSQPMCFNVFGYLRGHPGAPELLGRLLGLPVAAVDIMECEWAPQPAHDCLDDRTAFDAFVVYRTGSGERASLGIETKYTDTFSPTPYPAEKYRGPTDDLGWFHPGSAIALSTSSTNQIWRNALLAACVESKGKHGRGKSVVMALEGDISAWRAVDRVRAKMTDPARLLAMSLERVAAEATEIPGLVEWASTFRDRYLDASRAEEL